MNEDTHIERKLKEIEESLLATHAEREGIIETPDEIQQSQNEAKIPKALEKAGYPIRHIAKLKEMQETENLAHGKAYLPKVLSGDLTILLTGTRGPGKTQLATWWAAQRVLHGETPGIYIRMIDILADIKRTWGGGGKSIGTEQDILSKYYSAKYLVIDELQEIGGHDWELRYLTNIVDHRYGDMKATVLIGNIGEENLAKVIPASILDRINETGCLIEANWPSFRTKAA